uniref:Uncharacterized protein n=1 Tax=Oryza glumipatula TaxID=40148 RepID=A0A0E0A6D8_9ORYZ
MAGIVRYTIFMAMGAGALGGPDALRLLPACAGRSPLVDILIAVFVIAAVTAPALGTRLLARFFRKARAAGGGGTGAAAADPFAKMMLAVSLAVAVLVSATLILLPLFQSGHLGALAFAGAALAVGACAARVRGVLLPNSHGAAPATEGFAKATLMVSLAAVCFLLVPCIAVGILDAPEQGLLAFAHKNPLATVPVGVATVIGTMAIPFFFRKTQNEDAAAPTTAMALFHNHKMILALPCVPFFIPMASDLVMAIVLSLGCAVAGGPEALRILLGLSGRSPVADIAICAFLVCAATAPALGNVLLVRYFRVAGKANGVGGATAPAAVDPFARVTVAVALAVVFIVATCLLVVPSAGGRDPGCGAMHA